jgi:hypothetical protein
MNNTNIVRLCLSAVYAINILAFCAFGDELQPPGRKSTSLDPSVWVLSHPEVIEKIGLATNEMSAMQEILRNTTSRTKELEQRNEEAQTRLHRLLMTAEPDATASEEATLEVSSLLEKITQTRYAAFVFLRRIAGDQRMRTIVSLHNQAKSENLKDMPGGNDMDAIGWLQLHPKLVSDIGLGEADMDRLLELRYKSKRAAVPLEAALELAKLDLNFEMQKRIPSAETVKSLVAKVSEAELTIQVTHLHDSLAMRTVLGPERYRRLQVGKRAILKEQGLTSSPSAFGHVRGPETK